MAALAAVFCGAVIMTNLVTKAAAAAFMFPVALALAHHYECEFHAVRDDSHARHFLCIHQSCWFSHKSHGTAAWRL